MNNDRMGLVARQPLRSADGVLGIRDQSSLQEDHGCSTASLLLKCKRQVIYPYLCILCLVAWRPFGSQSMAYRQRCSLWKVVNSIYTVFFFCLIIFTYASHHISCNRGVDAHNGTTSVASERMNENLVVQTGASPLPKGQNVSSSIVPSVTSSGGWKLATFRQCKHLLTEYVVPELLHFLAVLTGFYLFRIQDNEDLNALVEKVVLYLFVRKNRSVFFFLSLVMLAIVKTAILILFLQDFGLALATGFKHDVRSQRTAVSFMILGGFMEAFVTAVTLMSFCAQCQLLRFCLYEICQTMEEKTKDLSALMKDVMDVKKNLSKMNGKISIITSLIVLCYLKITVAEVIHFMTSIKHNEKDPLAFLHRLLAPLLSFTFVMIPFVVAARFNAMAQNFKQKSLNVRVFGYPSATQLDQDSFILFTGAVEMKAKLMLMPIHGSYVSATMIVIMFGLLIMIQSDVIPTNTQYL